MSSVDGLNPPSLTINSLRLYNPRHMFELKIMTYAEDNGKHNSRKN